MSILCTTLVSLALAFPAVPDRGQPLRQDPGQADSHDFAAEYEALEREFEDAQDAFYEPLQKAESDEEREKVELDFDKEPTRVFLPRFQDLAARARGTEAGARALLWIVGAAREAEFEPAVKAVDELVDRYRDSPLLAQLCTQLQYGAPTIGIERAKAVLGKLGHDSPHAEVRAAALYTLGALLLREGEGSRQDAVDLLRRVTKEHAQSPWAKRAENTLYEAEHLQVGMAAPDFVAVDENGAAFELSKYRGKVVVIDFWGFW